MVGDVDMVRFFPGERATWRDDTLFWEWAAMLQANRGQRGSAGSRCASSRGSGIAAI